MPDIGISTRDIEKQKTVLALKKPSFFWVFILPDKTFLELVLKCVCAYIMNFLVYDNPYSIL